MILATQITHRSDDDTISLLELGESQNNCEINVNNADIMEISHDSDATSKLSASTRENEPNIYLEGRRIVDIQFGSDQLKQTADHAPHISCNLRTIYQCFLQQLTSV